MSYQTVFRRIVVLDELSIRRYGLRRNDVHTILLSTFVLQSHSEVVVLNNNNKFRSFKSKENIHKKEVGPYHGFGY